MSLKPTFWATCLEALFNDEDSFPNVSCSRNGFELVWVR